jgi:hypothetical protein
MDKIRPGAVKPGTEKGNIGMNPRKWLLGIVAAVLAAALPAPARADDAPPAAPAPANGPLNAYLVAVGAGEYKDKAIHARPTAGADAKALAALFQDPKTLGIPADRTAVLTGEAATRDKILKALDDAAAATGQDDLLILAFFGRGASVADKPCFLTADTVFTDRGKTALTIPDLEPVFKRLKGHKLLVLMDVAYKGYDVGKEKVQEPSVGPYLKLVFDAEEGEEESQLTRNRVVVFGNLPFREPLTKGDHGLFFSVLSDALRGKADEKVGDVKFYTGYEPDGVVTVEEMGLYLEKEIPNGAREIGKTDKERNSPRTSPAGPPAGSGSPATRPSPSGWRSGCRRSPTSSRPGSCRPTRGRRRPGCCSGCRS